MAEVDRLTVVGHHETPDSAEALAEPKSEIIRTGRQNTCEVNIVAINTLAQHRQGPNEAQRQLTANIATLARLGRDA